MSSEADYDKAGGIAHTSHRTISKNCLLTHQVYGWHPAWSGTAYERYDYALLSTIAYYAYEVEPKTGGYKSIHQWRETGLVEKAHHYGAQVELTAALDGKGVAQLLKNPVASRNLQDSLLALVRYKDADGICIDFSGLQAADKGLFADWVDSLAHRLRSWRKDATLTVTLPGEDETNAWDAVRLAKVVDRFVVKAYGYGGGPTSLMGRPLAPLKSSDYWGKGSVEASLKYWLAAGAPKNKLIAGVPYFGYEWPVTGNFPGLMRKVQTVTLRTYEAMDSSAFLQWDNYAASGWILRGPADHQRQLWIDEVTSLTRKYALVKSMNLAGVGIWALGYDHGSDRCWDLLKGQFADCSAMDADQLTGDAKPVVPGMDGPTSAERNVWNWVWILVGGVIAVAIILVVKKYM